MQWNPHCFLPVMPNKRCHSHSSLSSRRSKDQKWLSWENKWWLKVVGFCSDGDCYDGHCKYDEVEVAYEVFVKMFQRSSSFEDIYTINTGFLFFMQ